MALAMMGLGLIGLLTMATCARQSYVSRSRTHLDRCDSLLDAADSALAESLARLREALDGDAAGSGLPGDWRQLIIRGLRSGELPDETHALTPADARRDLTEGSGLAIGDVQAHLVRVTSPGQVRAGSAPHGILELRVTVVSRGMVSDEVTMTQRHLFYLAGRWVRLVGEPLGTVIE